MEERKVCAMMYLAYASSGKELDVADELRAMGVDVICPQRIVFKRTGKKRRPEPYVYPYLPNYLFISMTDEQFIEVQAVKHLNSTFKSMHQRDIDGVNAFNRAAQRELAEAERIRDNREAVEQYKAGQALQVLSGGLADVIMEYRETITRAHDSYPKIVASTEMMGQTVTVELDPIQVKAAE